MTVLILKQFPVLSVIKMLRQHKNLKEVIIKNNCLCLLLAMLLALPLGAMIHTTALGAEKGLLEILRDNGTITQEQYEELKKGAAKEPRIETKAKLEIKSADDQFKFQIGGRIHVDGAWYRIDKQDLGDGTELRRVHLDTSGTLWKDWHFTRQFDFANNDVSVRDAYLSYSELRPVTFKAGNFKVPHSLEVMMNNNWTTFYGNRSAEGLNHRSKNWPGSGCPW